MILGGPGEKYQEGRVLTVIQLASWWALKSNKMQGRGGEGRIQLQSGLVSEARSLTFDCILPEYILMMKIRPIDCHTEACTPESVHDGGQLSHDTTSAASHMGAPPARHL
jgi:hypothetical protein